MLKLALVALVLAGCGSVMAVLTQHNDNRRSGIHSETILTTANVRPGGFGKLFTLTLPQSPNLPAGVADRIYTQPLIVESSSPKLLIVATQSNMVYAFDATTVGPGAPKWHRNLGLPESANDNWSDDHCNLSLPTIGVLGTPVIVENGTGTRRLYVVTKTRQGGASSQIVSFTIHEMDVDTGADVASSPLPRTAEPAFDPYRQLQRASLVWVDDAKAPGGGYVYAAFGGHCDATPFHGWVFGFDGNLSAQVASFNSTPNGLGGGIWQAGQAPVRHGTSSASLFVSTGNGNGGFTNTVLKLAVGAGGALSVADSFTPYNEGALSRCDADLASAGPVLLDDDRFIVAGGKQGVLYVLDTAGKLGQAVATDQSQWQDGSFCTKNLGGGGLISSYPWNPQGDKVFQEFQATAGHIHGSPVYATPADGKQRLYIWSEEDHLKAFERIPGSGFVTTPTVSTVPIVSGMPGGALSVSTAGVGSDAIVWATHPSLDAWTPTAPVGGILYAFDAADVSKLLWSSDQQPEDALGEYSKFTAPTIADGRVYVATFSGQVQVYGLIGSTVAPGPDPGCAQPNFCGGCTPMGPAMGGCEDKATGRCGVLKCLGPNSVTCDTSNGGFPNVCGGCGFMMLHGSGHGYLDNCICNDLGKEEGHLVCAKDKNHLICCGCNAAPGCGPGAP
jgi:hypothetical protein